MASSVQSPRSLPAWPPGAEAFLTTFGVRGRCGLVGGDFFAAVPPGGDAYVLAIVIHDWSGAQARAGRAAASWR